MKYKEIALIFDTNAIKNSKPLNLLNLTFSDTYNTIKKFIDDNEYSEIKIYIPLMVLEELKKQSLEDYEDAVSSIKKIGDQFSKLNIKCPVNDDDTKNFYEFREKLNDSFEKHKNDLNILGFPKSEMFHTIIEKSLSKTPPFFGNGKNYSDAGFKDAVILETIVEFSTTFKGKIYFITLDERFRNAINDMNFEKIITINLKNGIALKNFLYESEGFYDRGQIIAKIKNGYFQEIIQKYFEKNHFKIGVHKNIFDNYRIEKVMFSDTEDYLENKETFESGENLENKKDSIAVLNIIFEVMDLKKEKKEFLLEVDYGSSEIICLKNSEGEVVFKIE